MDTKIRNLLPDDSQKAVRCEILVNDIGNLAELLKAIDSDDTLSGNSLMLHDLLSDKAKELQSLMFGDVRKAA